MCQGQYECDLSCFRPAILLDYPSGARQDQLSLSLCFGGILTFKGLRRRHLLLVMLWKVLQYCSANFFLLWCIPFFLQEGVDVWFFPRQSLVVRFSWTG